MIIKSEILYSVLLEGRLEDVKSKYPAGHSAGIDNLSQNDPSGNNKYLAWMVKMVLEQGSSPKHVIDAINYFHNNVVRFQQKDINTYKTLKDLLNAVEVAKAKITKKEVKEQGVEKIYEDENVTIVHPLTHAASCKYGSETRWCVTMKNDPNYFRHYSQSGPLFFFLDKRRLPNETGAPRKRYWKVAAHYNVSRCNIMHWLTRGTTPNNEKITKEKFIEIVKNCLYSRATQAIEFYNASDAYVTAKTVDKYIPNLPKMMSVLDKYVFDVLGDFYDSWMEYDAEIKEYEKQYNEYLKHRANSGKFVEAALRISRMSDELIQQIRLLDPEADIKGIEELIKKNWSELSAKRTKEVGDLVAPVRPKTQQPSLGKRWYDMDLDAKLDAERKKRNG